jgi:hypothetical protein
MKTHRAYARRTRLALLITLLWMGVQGNSQAAQASLASRYSDWAGGKANAEALVNGMRSGTTVMLRTSDGKGGASIAGFTPAGAMGEEEIAAALSSARARLAKAGINHPSADQIQAALAGGEITTSRGASRMVQGSVAPGPVSSVMAPH